MSRKYTKVDTETLKKVVQLLNSGKTRQEVSEELNISKRSLDYWVKRLRGAKVEINIKPGRKAMSIDAVAKELRK